MQANKKYWILFSLFFLWVLSVYGQDIPVGTWRTHLSYHNATHLALAEDKVYCATRNGLFVYTSSDAALQKITRLDGLSDTEISALAYHSENKILFIGYASGNIDMLSEDENVNIRTLFNRTNPTQKTIHHILFIGQEAFLSTPFGVVVVDMYKQQIKETYIDIGSNGKRITIKQAASDGKNLYLATSEGLRMASLSSQTNRLDFRNWQTILPDNSLTNVVAWNQKIYVLSAQKGILYFENGIWNEIPESSSWQVLAISAANQNLCALSNKNLYKVASSHQVSKQTIDLLRNPKEIFEDKQNKIWIADYQAGMISNVKETFASIHPSGMYSNEVFSMNIASHRPLVVSAGGFGTYEVPYKSQSGFYVFDNTHWTNYNASADLSNSVKTPLLHDIVASAYVPKENKTYFASFGNGLLVWNHIDNTFSVVDSTNSPLTTNRIVDVKTDQKGSLWIAVYDAAPATPAYFRKDAETWFPITPKDSKANYPIGIEVDRSGTVWAALSTIAGGGVYVLSSSTGEQRELSSSLNMGGLVNNTVLALHYDLDGNMWVGTEGGVCVFFNADAIFRQNAVNAAKVYTNSRQFLKDQKIFCIASDGANRKWIGTQEGSWLYDFSREEVIYHFTQENSPLPSNEVRSIAIHGQSGEVFMGTRQGIASYRSDATSAQPTFEEVKIFPNPANPTLDGVITISGLAENANVKITDINGVLAYEGYAKGGTLVWDGINYRGESVQSGVYLLYAATQKAEEKLVGKFLIVR